MCCSNQRKTDSLNRNAFTANEIIFLIPALFFFFIYVVIPIFQSLQLSLYAWNGLYDGNGQSTATFIGLENYRNLWVDPNFWISIKNNLLWLFLYMLAVPVGLMIAIFLNKMFPKDPNLDVYTKVNAKSVFRKQTPAGLSVSI